MSYYDYITRCCNCENDFAACDACVAKAKEAYDNRTCKQSEETEDPQPSNKCQLKSVSAKKDYCPLCGYKFIYP